MLHSWLWVIPSLYTLCCSPSPRSLFYTGSVLPGQGFHGLHCTDAHVLPMLCTPPLTLCASYTLTSPLYYSPVLNICWTLDLLGSFRSPDACVPPSESLIILCLRWFKCEDRVEKHWHSPTSLDAAAPKADRHGEEIGGYASGAWHFGFCWLSLKWKFKC